MAQTTSKKSRIWDFLLIFAIVTLSYQLIFRVFFPVQTPANTASGVVLSLKDETVSVGNVPVLTLKNNTAGPVTIADRCPKPPVDIFRKDGNGVFVDVTPAEAITTCAPVPAVEPGKKVNFSLTPWKQALFAETGTVEFRLPGGGTGAVATVTMTEPGLVTKAFRAFIMKPLLNALIFIASVLPHHSLGVAIIVLTLIVKILLYIPTQRSLEGQKKMQLLQPKIEEIRRAHKDDPVKVNQETMKLWKEHKINPFQSCLPLLVQFPVLFGLFYVVRDGVHLELSQYLIYPVYQHLDWGFNTQFLGLDLMNVYPWFFPPLLVLLQFLQMKLTFHIADKKKAQEIAKKTTPQADTPQEVQQRIMLYVFPLMIGFIAFKMPAAVSLYWGISTLFAIAQQMIVNREHLSVRS